MLRRAVAHPASSALVTGADLCCACAAVVAVQDAVQLQDPCKRQIPAKPSYTIHIQHAHTPLYVRLAPAIAVESQWCSTVVSSHGG